MEERLKIEQLIAEKDMAESLGVSKQAFWKLRKSGAPWLDIGGKVFFHGELFMEWLLKSRLKCSDAE